MYKIIKWKILHWNKIWRQLGFPTFNISLWNEKIDNGTYKGKVVIDGQMYKCGWVIMNEKKLFEWHILNFSENIYDKEIEVILHYIIRDNKNFKSLQQLKDQIELDIEHIKKSNDYVLTFGTFDYLHPGHRYYLSEAKKYGDSLVTIIANDENVKRFKWEIPTHSSKERSENVKELWLSRFVCIGDTIDPLKWIELYSPKVICLWYDQKWFSAELDNYIRENKLDITIIRISPYKPEIYKSSLIKSKSENKK